MVHPSHLDCGLSDILAKAKEPSCLHFYRELQAGSAAAEEAGEVECAGRLRVLADAASLHLRTDNPGEPFCPLMVFGDRRTAAPQDFDDSAVTILRASVPTIDQVDLRARVCDLLWVIRRDHKMAMLAVGAYLEAAELFEDPDMWPPTIERIERAGQIAVALGRDSEVATTVRDFARSLLTKYGGKDPLFMSARLIEILLDIGGADPEAMAKIADHAANLAKGQMDWHRAQTYLEIAARCRMKAGADDEARQSLIDAAEMLVGQAEDASKREEFLAASVHLQRGIEALRRIAGTKARVEQLHSILLGYQKASVKEMKSISVTLPTEELTKQAIEQVEGRDWQSAFLALGHISEIPSWQDLYDNSVKSVRDHPLQHLFSAMRVNADGKVVARSSGSGVSDEEGVEAAARVAMFQHACLRHQVTATAVINPARKRVTEDHDTSVDSILPLLSKSSFVPSDRSLTYARGLAAGFEGDYLLAAYLLIPQIEHCIRSVVAANGIVVSNLDHYGIQHERDLNYLLYQDYMDEMFTPGVVFDLKCLLVDPNGENFRNLLAHGLLPDATAKSPLSAYVWWMALHLLVGFWNPEPESGAS